MGKMFAVRWTENISMIKKRIVEANDIDQAISIVSASSHEDEEILLKIIGHDNFIAEEIEPK